MAFGEAGCIVTGSPTNNAPITVNLTEPLTNPVFALNGTDVGGHPYTLRVINEVFDANGDTISFDFIIEEWEYLDGPHGAVETINWLAIEEGVHTLPDGRIIEAGTTSATDTTSSVGFSAGFTAPPVVLTQVMSENDTTTVDSDPFNVSATGFDVNLEEEEAEDGIHAAEDVGWIAIQPGGSAATGTAGTHNNLDENTDTIGLGDTFTDPIVLADTQTDNNPDPGVVTIDGGTNSTTDLYVREEKSADSETNAANDVVGFAAFNKGLIVCFAAGTHIQTKDGERLVEELQSGDLILTADGSYKALRLAMTRQVSSDETTANPKLLPIRIMAGALGNDLPKRDLLVSRQHRMLASSRIVERMFGTAEVLVPAIKLTALPGIFIDEGTTAPVYVHLLFDRHEVIFAEGAPTESLFTGPEAMRSVSPEAREEMLTLFPELATGKEISPPARMIPSGKLQKELIARHVRQSQPLTQADAAFADLQAMLSPA